MTHTDLSGLEPRATALGAVGRTAPAAFTYFWYFAARAETD
jgi:hypothetical protein